MTVRSKSEIETSMQQSIQTNSPQLRTDVDNGPFYYLSIKAASQVLADASVDTERMALLSTQQFPSVATNAEVAGTIRAFALSTGQGGYSQGTAYVHTARRPLGTESFDIREGDLFSTAEASGKVFQALESRSLTAANADAFFNASTRRFELPVAVRAIAAGTAGNIAALNLREITSGAPDFDGVTNYARFRDGKSASTNTDEYVRVQERMQGLDNFSRGGLPAIITEVDPSRISAVALTYSSEYPVLFFRLPDDQAVDCWLLSASKSVLTTDTFTALAGQTDFVLNNKPVISLNNAFVNGAPVSSQLVIDESKEIGRSTEEESYVVIAATAANDIVDITYTYDGLLGEVQSILDGALKDTDTGALFDSSILVRYSRTEPVVISVSGTVLGTFDPTTVETEVTTVVGNYLANGTGSAPALGGYRSPAELRDQILSQVPGVATLSISVFCRKSVAPLVETIDIMRFAQPAIALSTDLTVSFT